MKWFNILCLILALAWTVFLARGFKTVPALGPMLEVHSGVWAHRNAPVESTTIEGLKNPVTVAFDANGVPHFFAQNESDLFMAQGFVIASQRLFQLDLMSRITAGRLSEWFGERALKTDRFFVNFGMRESARKILERYNQDSRVANVLSSYTAGINAYIGQMRQPPPEYVILGIAPDPWDAAKIVHMGRQLTFGLGGRSYDHYLSKIQQTLGNEKVLDLFPEFSALDDIVYPTGKKTRRRAETASDFNFTSSLKQVPFFPLPAAGNGSNNWAVNAKKSATGSSIMANDTHLDLTLPNVWYEAQLNTPQFNVYGVGLIGVPGIINGMNALVSWGPTNGTTDVLDYYEVDLRQKDLIAASQKERILVRGAEPAEVEVDWTRMGVIVHREGDKGLAMAWGGHSADNELKSLYSLYGTRNLDECLNAFRNWFTPIVNFVCADRSDVGIQATGFLPKRSVGEGRFIMKPGDFEPMNLPIPEAERPRVVRPASGFVLSANERQTGADYPHYLGWDFEEPFRGSIIRRRLQEKDKFSADDMIRIQNDSYDLVAEQALPLMLKTVDRSKLDSTQSKALEELAQWDRQDLATSRVAAVFSEWMEQLTAALFADEYQVQAKNFFPKTTRVIELLQNLTKNSAHKDAYWVDNRETKEVEDLGMVVTASFVSAWKQLAEDQGSDHAQWNFKKWINIHVPHVGRLPGFGVEGLAMDGSRNSVRGNQGKHGASYKFVVAHGDWPKAWIQVPGGNEGDPFSRDYERFVLDWSEGKMRPVEFYKNEDEAKAAAVRTVVLSPRGT